MLAFVFYFYYNLKLNLRLFSHVLALIGRAGGQWDLSSYHVIDLGQSQYSVRCLCVVADKDVWCGHRNNIHILNSRTLAIEVTSQRLGDLFFDLELELFPMMSFDFEAHFDIVFIRWV